MQTTRLELKYCERCGALGLRRLESGDNYCEGCAQLLSQQASALRVMRHVRHGSRKSPRLARTSSPRRIGVPA